MITTIGTVEPVAPMVSVWTPGWGWVREDVTGTAPTSGTWTDGANTGIYFQIWVPTTCVVRRMWTMNGATATGNWEAGIYRDATGKPGAKVVATGSVTQTGTSVVQFADITDTVLTPQAYWLFLSCSSSSATIYRSTMAAAVDEQLRMEQASVGPGSSPATATPVESTSTVVLLFGFSTTTIS